MRAIDVADFGRNQPVGTELGSLPDFFHEGRSMLSEK